MNRRLACLAVVLFALQFTGLAQENADLENGLKPFGSYRGGELDTVSMTNGNLMVQIPIIAFGQRGDKLGLQYFLQLGSKT